MPLKINEISTMPQMQEAIDGWEIDVIVNQKRQSMVDGDVVYKNVLVKMRSVIQPLKMSDLELKTPQEREWEWFYLHIKSNYPALTVNQQVFIKGNPYKVMKLKDYHLNGFREYEVIRDYEQHLST